MRAALVDELGAQQAAIAQQLALGLDGLIDHTERVAALQVAAEIDLARENIGQLRGHPVGQVGCFGGGK